MNLQFVAVVAFSVLTSHDFPRYGNAGFFAKFFVQPIVGKFGRVNALYQVSCRAENNEGKPRHFSNPMHVAGNRNDFSVVFTKFRIRNFKSLYFAVYFVHKITPVSIFDNYSNDGIIITLILLVKQLFKAVLGKILFKTIVKSTVLC